MSFDANFFGKLCQMPDFIREITYNSYVFNMWRLKINNTWYVENENQIKVKTFPTTNLLSRNDKAISK